MKIAVCDDEVKQLEYISGLASHWSEKMQDAQVFEYKSAEELIFNYFPGKFDVMLLDIQMSGQSGIDLAKKIRDCNDKCSIIFITAISDYVFEGYDVGAVSYLVKPISPEKLFSCLDKCAGMVCDEKKVVFEAQQEMVTFYESEIYYIEALARKTIIHLKDEDRELSVPFAVAVNALSADFFQCHRSYCINISRIRSLRKYEAFLDNAVAVPVSRRLFAELNREFIKYYR